MIKLIIFDWDDVFTHGSTEGYFKCYHAAVKGVGVDLPFEEEKKRILAKWGQSHIEEIRELLKENPHLVKKAVKLYEEHLFGKTFVNCLSLVAGSTLLLKRLSVKYSLAVATGIHPMILKQRVMPKFDVPNVFKQVLSVYDIPNSKGKPDPYMLEKIMQAQGIRPDETILVGDAQNDVLMAQNAHVEPVVVLTGHLSRSEAEILGVAHIIENVTFLESTLKELEIKE